MLILVQFFALLFFKVVLLALDGFCNGLIDCLGVEHSHGSTQSTKSQTEAVLQ